MKNLLLTSSFAMTTLIAQTGVNQKVVPEIKGSILY